MVSPNVIHSRNTGLVSYFERYLLQMAMSVFKWTLPEDWERNFLLQALFRQGYITVFRTPEYGTIAMNCTVGGVGLWYQPVWTVVANPLLTTNQMAIGSECSLIRLQPDYGGIMDLVHEYADRLALASESTGINILNSKLSYVFRAGSKQGAETLKKMYDEIASGSPAAFFDPGQSKNGEVMPWDTFCQNVGQNFIAPELLEYSRRTLSEFCVRVGIPANPNDMKKERQLVDEVHANDVETRVLSDLWFEQLTKDIDKTVELFPELSGKLSVRLRYDREEALPDESDNVSSGPVSV